MKWFDRAMVLAAVYALLMPLALGMLAFWEKMPVLLKHLGSSTMASWVQAIGSIAAIFVSVIASTALQDRGRLGDFEREVENQIVALRAIAERCVDILGRLEQRGNGHKGGLHKDVLGYLSDEIEAAEKVAGALDLGSLRAPVLIQIAAELQEVTRMGRRRLGYKKPAIRKGKITTKDFDEPYSRATAALERLRHLENNPKDCFGAKH